MNDIHIADLWRSSDRKAWEELLEVRYWSLVKPKNIALERKLEPPEIDHLRNRVRNFDAEQWYSFLKDEYFHWKFTNPTQLPTHLRSIQRHENNLDKLDQIRKRLLNLDHIDASAGLNAVRGAAGGIHGLGVAGASGLLALVYPETFGTVDQFVVGALRQVGSLPEPHAAALVRMKPKNLTVEDGVLLIGIMHRKASDNNRDFGVTNWTPRKIDKVLWTYDETGRPRDR